MTDELYICYGCLHVQPATGKCKRCGKYVTVLEEVISIRRCLDGTTELKTSQLPKGVSGITKQKLRPLVAARPRGNKNE